MEIVVFWVLLAIGVGFLASSRGRSGFGFFLLSLVLSPLIGLIVVLVTDNLKAKKEQVLADEREHARRLEEVRALTTATTSTASSGHSVAAELERLAALKATGVLTEAEFNEQKAKILKR